MARLEVEGEKSIYYEDYSGDGAPIVLVHGWGMSARCWDYNVPALRDAGHRVVALDHRACGSSDKDFDEVSISAIAGDVVELVGELGLDRPAIVGWSMGGAVTVEAAAKLGDGIRGMVLIGAASPRYTKTEGWDIGGDQETMDQTVEALRVNRANFLHDLSVGVFKEDPGAAVIEWTWNIFMQASCNADSALAGLADIDHRDLLPTLEVPALICAGPDDQVVAYETSVKAAEMLPNGRLVDFANSGHAPFIEEREKFDGELLGFLADL